MPTGNDLVETVIKTRKEILYLVSETDLQNLKLDSLMADLAMLFAAGALGAYFSGQSSFFLVASLFSIVVACAFYYKKAAFVKRAKESGEVEAVQKVDFALDSRNSEELHVELAAKPGDLVLIRAIWGADDRTIDITEIVREKIVENRLTTMASNAVAGQDPAYGTMKYLELEYEYGGTKITKRFREDEAVSIP